MCSIEQVKNSYIFCGKKKKKKKNKICGKEKKKKKKPPNLWGGGRGGKKNAGHKIWGASRLQLVREICD